MSGLRIALLYPEALGTYGDGGNAVVLERRMAWRGEPASVVPVPVGTPVPVECDLYLLGGGEDDAQALALEGLNRSQGLRAAVDRGAVVFAVCAGLQLLGTTFEVRGGQQVPGLGVLDVTTTRLPRRAVGEVVARVGPELGLPELTGFENHGGGTALGPQARPLAQVVTGTGNGLDPPGGEGVVQGGVLATYLHGPVLARNPALADLLLARACGRALPPLEVPAVEELRRQRLTAARTVVHSVG